MHTNCIDNHVVFGINGDIDPGHHSAAQRQRDTSDYDSSCALGV
jgi:hypothetical protein